MTSDRKVQIAALVAIVNGAIALAFPPLANAQACGTTTIGAPDCLFGAAGCEARTPPGCILVSSQCFWAPDWTSTICTYAPAG